jgi:hypothetical protein
MMQGRNLRLMIPKVLTVTLLAVCLSVATAQLPGSLDDDTFRTLVETLSEPEGRFPPQYMSNEDSLQFVIPELIELARPGGVYIGVGSEQNFTYMAALRPALAFIVDIRRDNLRQLLLYKALFELSPDRATFLSKLFARPLTQAFDPDQGVGALFAAFEGTAAEAGLYESTRREIFANLVDTHSLALDDADRDGIVRILDVFRDAGPDGLKGLGDPTNPTFAELMAATDLEGNAWGFLASETNYAAIRDLHARNRVVPVVGDFAGDKALPGIARFVEQEEGIVNVFYVSNVERYLWEQGDHGKTFYDNLALLPRDDDSLLVRSVTSDISVRLGIPIPDQPAKWRTFVTTIAEDLDGIRSGRIASYRDLISRASSR